MKYSGVYILTILVIASCTNYRKISYRKAKKEVLPERELTITKDTLDSIRVAEKQKIDSTIHYYENAFNTLHSMLSSEDDTLFKHAVFQVEYAYHEGNLNYFVFDNQISNLYNFSRVYRQAIESNFDYDFDDRDFVLSHQSLFSTLKDTIRLSIQGDTLVHTPYTYLFEDFNGKKEWSNTFVSSLLVTKKGNCQSLSYLYKILSDEYGVETHLTLAPRHIYISHSCQKTGMYNTELTDGSFPIDGWIMASGYIHLDAVRSGIYMKPLSNRESIALCLIDLAHGYMKKYGFRDGEFVNKCAEQTLEVFPNCIRALLLKAYVLEKKRKQGKQTSQTKKEFENLIIHIHELGYRRMPDEMYLAWLTEQKKN